jgi:AcrR family transcriptional regulator
LKKGKADAFVPRGTKDNETKIKILNAAKKIFSEYPYHTASIRMIGDAAGLNFPLVAYYFSSKAALFEAVLDELGEEYYQALEQRFAEIAGMGSTKGLSLYIDRLLEFTQTHPETLRTILLNVVQAKGSQVVPGYRIMQKFFNRSVPHFKKTSSARATDNEIENFSHNFNTLVVNYLGADAYYAGVLGLEPNSPEYRRWVKENLIALFMPHLKRLIRGGSE